MLILDFFITLWGHELLFFLILCRKIAGKTTKDPINPISVIKHETVLNGTESAS